MEIGTSVEPDPSESNPYHANIIIDEDEALGNVQALMLADASKVVYMDSVMKWVIV